MKEFWLIVGMTIVTFGVRYPSLALVGKLQLPESIIRALNYVPVAVLTAIIVPYVLYREDGFSVTFDNSYLIAAIVAIIVSAMRKSLLLTICVGLMAFLLHRLLLA
ncbi:MAG: branched-chain amino acid transport [Phototrophicales bacterium]|nr:MAG: branched-chain amino acid transport [Phototrophicales bacterium]